MYKCYTNIRLSKITVNSIMSHIPSVDLSSMRKPYNKECDVLLEDNICKNPFTLFHQWFETVRNCEQIYESNAVCLATADINGKPSARMVLLKGYGSEGFTVFTNTESRKGNEMNENPNAALLFFWDVLKRQIRIEGTVERVSEDESLAYFSSRPKGSQLAASISNQSQTVESRDVLVERYKNMESKFPNDVPKPDFWGGYRIVPNRFEFWQGQSNRLHDRIIFRKLKPNEVIDNKMTKMAENGWGFERLQP